MNFADYLTQSVKPLFGEDHYLKHSGGNAFTQARKKLADDKFKEALSVPRTSRELQVMLGYTEGGLSSMLTSLRKRDKIVCIGMVRNKFSHTKVWKWKGE